MFRGFFLVAVIVALLGCYSTPELTESGSDPRTRVYFNDDTGHWYRAELRPAYYSTAARRSEKEGGYLVVIDDEAENLWVRSTFSRLPTVTGQPAIIIGLTDRAQEGVFVTSLGDPPRFFNWAGGEPNNGEGGAEEDAVQMYLANGAWNDIPKTESYPYVIEYEQSPLMVE